MEWNVRYINYPLHFRNHETEIMETIHEVLSRGDLILRQQTEQFESNLAAFCGTKYAIGTSNCTDALFLTLRAAGIGQGDEVITVSHTFVATAAAITHTGAQPVLVDIADDHNIDPSQIEHAITERTRAIVPVSLNGRCAALDQINEIAQQHDLIVIEDSAQALGGTLHGRSAGSWGLAGCFSFYPAKLLGTFGDAGAIVTDDTELADKIRLLRNHGRTPDGEIAMWSYNCRIDNLHAAILDKKLQWLPDCLKRRRQIARIYHDQLNGVPGLLLPPPPAEDGPRYDVFQNYEIEAIDVQGLIDHLTRSGIETMKPWGGKGVHQFSKLNLGPHHLPRTEQLFDRAVMLPMYPELTDEEVHTVACAVKSFCLDSVQAVA